ncbi:MAG: precorrin-6y C5,15-methyltransferase (decarboxylating) subunit CbiE [Pseudomonadota bacterium]
MSDVWLHVIGIGENGLDGLGAEARELVETAEVIVGGDRHHKLAMNPDAQRIAWPSPFDAMIETIKGFRGKRIVVLVTGDPLWFSVGARLTKAIDRSEIKFHPQLSSFQWASCRLGWSLADVETVTVHGRPVEQILPLIAPDAQLLILTKDKTSPETVARMLRERGYGQSRMIVLAAMGGPDEQRFEGIAQDWHIEVPDFHVLAVSCVAGEGARVLPRTGLPDDVFVHDGKMTKQAVRALTIAKLAPVRAGMLWDVGCGCGSVAIEWMRGAPEARAIGIEPNAHRRKMAMENALVLGAPALQLIEARAPEGMVGLPDPDAVFIGGGLTMEVAEKSLEAIKPFGRLVANAVTLESEGVLGELHRRHGGDLVRISASAAEPVGGYRGWRTAMPVTQWSLAKGHAA